MKRRIVRKMNSSSDYAIRTRSRKPIAQSNRIQPVSEGERLDTATLRELESLRLRVSTLIATNINLRRHIRGLEAQLVARV